MALCGFSVPQLHHYAPLEKPGMPRNAYVKDPAGTSSASTRASADGPAG